MKRFKIPVSWEVYATVKIEANTLEEAIAIFDKTEDDIPLPDDWYYIDGSFKRETEEFCYELNQEK